MHVRQNGQPLEEADSLKYLGSQMAVDGGCEMDALHNMNRGTAWGSLKTALNKVDWE